MAAGLAAGGGSAGAAPDRSRGLEGRHVLCTRDAGQAAALIERLEALGVRVSAVATIRIAPPEAPEALVQALRSIPEQDWVVFTSANGVAAATAEALAGARVAAVGQATADALRALGVRVALMPARHTGAALGQALCERGVEGQRILLLRSEIAGQALPDALRAGGALVRDVTAYRTLPGADVDGLRSALSGGVDLVVLTSGSTARHLVEMAGPEFLSTLAAPPLFASIGPVTSAVAEALGLAISIQAQTQSIDGLVAAIHSFAFPAGRC